MPTYTHQPPRTSLYTRLPLCRQSCGGICVRPELPMSFGLHCIQPCPRSINQSIGPKCPHLSTAAPSAQSRLPSVKSVCPSRSRSQAQAQAQAARAPLSLGHLPRAALQALFPPLDRSTTSAPAPDISICTSNRAVVEARPKRFSSNKSFGKSFGTVPALPIVPTVDHRPRLASKASAVQQ
jgi:hypothetical protein